MTTSSQRQKRDRQERLALDVLKQFRLIYGSVREHFRDVEKTCGISGSQLWIIREIQDAPGIGVSALAEKLAIHQSTCSQLLESLVTRGYIIKARLADDQRRVGLTLTKAAKKALTNAPGPAEGVLPEALSGLSSQSLATLSAHLDKLIAELRLRDERYSNQPLADL